MAYRADIEIAVRGAQELKRLQNEVSATSKLVDQLNNYVQNIGSGGITRSINNLRDLVNQTATAFNKAALGTDEATIAANKYVQATTELNAGLRERALLLKQIAEQERKTRLASSGIRETTQYAGPIGPGQASPVALSSQLRGRTQQILAERKGAKELEQVLAELEERRRLETNAILDQKAASVSLQAARKKEKFLAGATQYAGPIGPGPASPVGALVGQKSPVEERIRQTIRARQEEKDLQQALLQLEQKSARLANEELQARSAIAAATAKSVNAAKFAANQTPGALMLPAFKERGLQILNDNVKLNESNLRIERALNGERARGVRFLEKQSAEEKRQIDLGILGQKTNRLPGQGIGTTGSFPVSGPIPLSQFGQNQRGAASFSLGQTIKGRAGGAVGNAIIGGAFPLLFGQGGGAAAGGAIGGLVGGAFGGVGGFAGSLVGTLLGDIASRGQAVKQLGEDLGFSAEQTKILSEAFKTANTDVEKFTAVIQNIRGVGLELEDQARAVELVTRLTEVYGGSFEKTGNAITSALESGRVSQATLNQLTSQGINIQEALATKLDVSENALLEMARKGKVEVQTLIDVLVALGNEPEKVAAKTQTASERFQSAISGLSKTVGPELERLAGLFASFGAAALEALNGVLNRLGQVGTQIENALSGPTLKNAKEQFSRDAARLKTLYTVPSNQRTPQQVQTIMALENLQQGRMQVIQAAQPKVPTPLKSFTAPRQAAPTSGSSATGAKPPEDRTAMLQAELQAIIAIGNAEDLVRDLRFEQNAIEAINIESSKALADIERDRIKQLKEMNYLTEKDTVNKIAQARAAIVQKERADKVREEQKRQTENFASALRGVEYEIQLTDARIAGTERQAVIEQKIADIRREQTYLTEDQIEAYRQLLELANQRKDAEEVATLEKQIATTGAGLGAGFIGPAGSAFEQQLAAGKSLERATQIAQLNQELQIAQVQAQGLESSIMGIGAAFGTAMTFGISELVKGTKTAKEVFADFLDSVGASLLEAAGQMIATYTAIGIARIFAGLAGGGSSGGTGDLTSGIRQYPLDAAGNFTPNLTGFAEGGFVTGPTNALIGEGGQPEYVIPFSKMDNAMANHAAGARGEDVFGPLRTTSIPFTKTTERLMTERSERETVSAINNPKPLDVRYQSQVINGVEYVTAEQHQRGMTEAAERGRALALSALQNSVKTRKRVGMS